MARKPGTPRVTPGSAKNAIAVAKVVAPAVIPVMAPYLVKATGVLRDRWDRHRARKMGVDVGELAQYSGHGGALHARIAGVAAAIADLPGGDEQTGKQIDKQATEQATTRLRQLTAAVRAAERMPSGRRRAAHKAVDAELTAIEERLLRDLGV